MLCGLPMQGRQPSTDRKHDENNPKAQVIPMSKLGRFSTIDRSWGTRRTIG